MRLALPLLLGLIALCSCAAKPAPDMLTMSVDECPGPATPVPLELDPALPLDHATNVEALMNRDDAMRSYIMGLRSCLECYRARH